MSFFTNIGEGHHAGRKAVQGVFFSDYEFTSALLVQAYQRVNVGIMIGSQISDIISAAGGVGASVAVGVAISAPAATASMSITLQRQYPEEMGGPFWHDVDSWSVTIAEAEAASSENISDKSEPETMMYRVGIKTGEYESGCALIRLGTS